MDIKTYMRMDENMSTGAEKIYRAFEKANAEMARAEEKVIGLQASYDESTSAINSTEAEIAKIEMAQRVHNSAVEQGMNSIRAASAVFERYGIDVSQADEKLKELNATLDAQGLKQGKAEEKLWSAADAVEAQKQKVTGLQSELRNVQSQQEPVTEGFKVSSQAAAALNRGISQGTAGMGQFGRVGLNTLRSIIAGMKTGEAAAIAMNAALTLGVGLAVAAIVQGIPKLIEKIREANKSLEDLQSGWEKAAREEIYSSSRMTSGIAAQRLIQRYQQLERSALGATEKQEKMNAVTKALADQLPEVRDYIDEVTGAFKVQGQELDRLMGRLGNLAEYYKATAEAEAYSKLYGEALADQLKLEYKMQTTTTPEDRWRSVLDVNNGLNLWDRVVNAVGGLGGMGAGALGLGETEATMQNELNELIKQGGKQDFYLEAMLESLEKANSFAQSTGDLLKSGKTKVQTDEIKIKEEDLRMMHDIATRRVEFVYQQLTPQVNVNIDTIAKEVDADRLLQRIADGVVNAASQDLEVAPA